MNTNKEIPYKIYLEESELPKYWYNMRADMKNKPAPLLNSKTLKPMTKEELSAVFCDELIEQELDNANAYIPIPEEIIDFYKMYRPSPLVRAYCLEKKLQTPAKIYYKFEGNNTRGSHQLNSAIAQAYYAKKQGLKGVTTETGAGQWGTALSMASAYFGLDCQVYMVKCSYEQKPFRREVMRTYGAKVTPSPSTTTEIGRKILEEFPGTTGSLGCAISESPLGKQVLNQLNENLDIAANDMIPICQDTGMAVVFINVGQDVHFTNGNITDAINEGVRQGYVDGYLRKSVVNDPIIRENTKDNTPAVIHYNIVPGDKVDITVAPKGFGSENMSRIFMLKPADGIEGVKNAILTAVKDAGPNACPPMVVGVGIGGTFEKCALLAKKALTRNVEEESPVEYVRELEREMLDKINRLGIGPGGLGGTQTALAINIETYPTHIAGLPVAVNICCHVNRHSHRVI